jgi:hypothetical protein
MIIFYDRINSFLSPVEVKSQYLEIKGIFE